MDRVRCRATAALLTLALCLLAAGCSGSDDGADAGDGGREGLSLSFIQIRIDEGSPFAQLRVVNETGDDLAVTGVGLDWPGFGSFVTDYETTVTAGRILDLRFQLPTPSCETTSAPVVGRLRLATGDGDRVVEDVLDESGAGYVTRIWDRWCQDLRADSGVTLTYGDDWTIEGSGRRARLVGELTLERGDEPGRIELSNLRGTVLLELHLPRPAVIPPDADRVTVPLVMEVPRCDEHALTESSQTFHFQAAFRFGEDVVSALRIPRAATREAGQRLLDEACVVDGQAD